MTSQVKNRDSIIIKSSTVGIVTNLILSAFKAYIGFISNSIAIVMDAVNNLSDASSSVITIVGTKLAQKEPDKKHPFGHGRIEYISAFIISVIIFYAGFTAFTESIKKIINPQLPSYSFYSLVVVFTAVLIKIILGRFFIKVGNKVNSDSLVNSGKDALFDSVISASTLLAALVFLFFKISLESYLGAVISVFIVKSAIQMLKETISRILGERTDAELAKKIKSSITSHPEISGCYDLIVHNYGPNYYQGSVHIEVADTLTADYLDKLIRKISLEIYNQFGVILTAVGVYSINTKDAEIIEHRDRIFKIIRKYEEVLQVHGFYFDKKEKSIRFDVVISFDAKDKHEIFNRICNDVKKEYPQYSIEATMDLDYSDI